jgi:incFII family plasmid replication initiator RepA
VEWENLQRKKQKLKPLEMDELIAKAWRFVRERFRSYQAERKSHGRKRDTARRDASRQRHDIETRVRQQLTREYATGRFRGDKEALKREVERRVQERMLLSRGNNYTRWPLPHNITFLKKSGRRRRLSHACCPATTYLIFRPAFLTIIPVFLASTWP